MPEIKSHETFEGSLALCSEGFLADLADQLTQCLDAEGERIGIDREVMSNLEYDALMTELTLTRSMLDKVERELSRRGLEKNAD